jgi:holliday junction DNA helicase RuvA
LITNLNGILISKASTEAVVECAGVGYGISVSLNTAQKLPEIGEKVKIFTLLIPKEDSINLYGFWTEAEREAFKMLTSVSGVGAKIALAILSSLTLDELQSNIIIGNSAQLSKLPGIGKKTAERLIVDLKDKIGKLAIPAGDLPHSVNLVRQEAISALLTLGFNRLIADKAIKAAIDDFGQNQFNAEELIKKALKFAMA